MSAARSLIEAASIATSLYCPPLGAALAGAAIASGAYFQRKAEETQALMLKEISQSRLAFLSSSHRDDLISMFLRLMRANIEGCGHDNLRTLARLINSERAEKPIYANEFLAYAEHVSNLDSMELNTLAAFIRTDKEMAKDSSVVDRIAVSQRVVSQLVPDLFADSEEFFTTCAALGRTGFLANKGGFSGGTYYITSRLRKLEEWGRLSEMTYCGVSR